MTPQEAISFIEAWANGTDPTTGTPANEHS